MQMRGWSKAVLGTVALAAALALGAGGGGVATGSRIAPGTKVRCRFDVKADWQGNRRGSDHAVLKCGKPLGRGTEHDHYTAKTTANKATLTAQTTDSFADGTLRGRLDLERGYVFPGPPTSYLWFYTGVFRFTGGTGEYSHAKGIAAVTCQSGDQGIHVGCALGAALTGI